MTNIFMIFHNHV